MKYIITGSIGHISKPIVAELVSAGHDVTVITSNASREEEIKALGAHAAVGSVEDRGFITQAFEGADAAYLMVPPKWTVTNWIRYQMEVIDNYIAAAQTNNVKHIVALSSVGAHMRKGAGPVDGLGCLEEELAKLQDVNIFVLRPSYFFYNLYSQIGLIKHAGFVGSTQPADFKIALAHTNDIAAIMTEKLLALDFTGYSVHNFASDDRHTWQDVTKALGIAIGKPDLNYVELTDQQSEAGMLQAGLSPAIVAGYVEMGQALRGGEMQADFWANPPKTYGKVKLEDFAKEFAAAFNAAS